MKKLTTLAVSALLFAACSKEINTNESSVADRTANSQLTQIKEDGVKPVRGTAQVVQSNLGNGWLLEFNGSQSYAPVNLPEKYQVNNLLVDVAYLITSDKVACNCETAIYYIDIKSITSVGVINN